jgi:hypothetical protein
MIPVLRRGVYYGAQGDDASVSDEDIYPPETLDGSPNHAPRVLGHRDVAHDGLDLDTLAGQPLP